jgi:hypothetical protein
LLLLLLLLLCSDVWLHTIMRILVSRSVNTKSTNQDVPALRYTHIYYHVTLTSHQHYSPSFLFPSH